MAKSQDPDVNLLAALGDPVRLSIVRMLAEADAVCACDFTDCCDVRQPTVSHHLRVLREAGIVRSERRSSWVYYSLVPSAAERLASIARSLSPAPPLAAPFVAGKLRGRRLPVQPPTA